MNYEQICKRIEERKEEFFDIWAKVSEIESPTKYKKGVDECANWFMEYAKEKGWDVKVHKEEISGNPVCITMNSSSKEAPVAISGHIDTVHELGSFGTPTVRFDENNIYGPGVSDCKGGVVAGLMAMAVLQELGYTKRPIQLLLQTDEETGSFGSKKGTIKWIGEQAKDAVAFLNLEPGRHDQALGIQRKGIIRYQCTVKGKAIHSAACYNGINPIKEAAHKIIEIERMQVPDGITMNVGVIHAGLVPNSVPQECTFSVDIRYANHEQYLQAKEYVEGIFNHSYIEGSTCEYSLLSERVAMEYRECNIELANKLNAIFKDAQLTQMGFAKCNGGADSADITMMGIPCVDCLGPIGGFIHSIQEYAILDTFIYSAKRIACAIAGL